MSTLPLLLIASTVPAATFDDVPLTPRTTIHFATVAEGKGILTENDDDYLKRLSAFDRSSRLMVNREVTQDEFLQFVKGHVLEWTDEEVQKVSAAVKSVGPVVAKYNIDLPKQINIVKTTGREEGGAAYTRGTSIMFPQPRMARSGDLSKLFAHELFHVLSRADSTTREQLYAMIGFRRTPEIKLPKELQPLRITNPDAPVITHTLLVTHEGRPVEVATVLFASKAYDGEAGKKKFFAYLQMPLMAVERNASGQRRPIMSNNKPLMLQRDNVVGFYEQVGRNTRYIIHPEEILADNFADLVTGRKNWASSEIPIKLRAVLTRPGPAEKKQ